MLPNRSRASVARRKVTAYLLSVAHPVGGAKAQFFESRGYSVEVPERLEQSLLEIASEGAVTKEEASEWGTKYVVEGVVEAPDGNPLSLATVWIIDDSGDPSS